MIIITRFKFYKVLKKGNFETVNLLDDEKEAIYLK